MKVATELSNLTGSERDLLTTIKFLSLTDPDEPITIKRLSAIHRWKKSWTHCVLSGLIRDGLVRKVRRGIYEVTE